METLLIAGRKQIHSNWTMMASHFNMNDTFKLNFADKNSKDEIRLTLEWEDIQRLHEAFCRRLNNKSWVDHAQDKVGNRVKRVASGTYISFNYFGELSEGDFVMLALGERTHYFKVTKVEAENPHVLEIEAKDTRSLPQGIDLRKLIGLEIQKVTDSQQIQNIQKSLCQI